MLLQPKLNLKVAQRQVLTPGLVQMVSVLALNKLELKEMINTEIIENPVLEEIEDSSESYQELAGREGDRELSAEQQKSEQEREEKDPFDEIDMGEYFQEYLDPGFRVAGPSFEDVDTPSFENFLSKPSTLTDHLLWQLSFVKLRPQLRAAAEAIIGNLEDSGYLLASDEDLAVAENTTPELIAQARAVIQTLDPIGIAARDLRECLILQIHAATREAEDALLDVADPGPSHPLQRRLHHLHLACRIVRDHLALLQKRDHRELTRLLASTPEEINAALELIRSLDPRPGLRYNHLETRLIEPDVAFVRRGDEWVVVMNEEDMPALRLNSGYRRMLHGKGTDREGKEYLKERFRSAIQLLRNLEQRKNTIVHVCEAIVRRQRDFLEKGVDALRPMMIKEVAEEIGVHPSTVSRAVSSKYVHTPQGVFELRYFFSESVQGPEGGNTSLLILKRRVKKLIDEEDPARPLTDEQLTRILQSQGIQVTRRTVAKYREDMNIPSTHQRRKRD